MKIDQFTLRQAQRGSGTPNDSSLRGGRSLSYVLPQIRIGLVGSCVVTTACLLKRLRVPTDIFSWTGTSGRCGTRESKSLGFWAEKPIAVELIFAYFEDIAFRNLHCGCICSISTIFLPKSGKKLGQKVQSLSYRHFWPKTGTHCLSDCLENRFSHSQA